MEKIRKKTTIYALVASILVISLGVAYAYWVAFIEGEGTPMNYETVNNLKIIFKEDPGVSEGVITPGWKVTKTFNIKNESSGPFKYNIVIKNLQNTFVTDFLQYKITSSDGFNMSEYESVPKGDENILAYNVEIEGGATQNYTVEFYYENSETVNQSEDVGKNFGGTLGITEGTIDKRLFSILSNGVKYDIDTRTSFEEVIGGETVTQDYNSTGKIYMTNKASETEDGTTNPIYYFAGNPSDNWVKFAGFYWRIIRTDATKGVKLLYAGETHDGTNGYVAGKSYQYQDIASEDKYKIKYQNSSFKNDLESWYTESIGSNYDDFISTTAKYCNDTSEDAGNYGAYTRLITNKTPTYKCPIDKDNLSLKAGLMTADEIAFAGGVYSKTAPNTYYYRNSKIGVCSGTSGDACSIIGDNLNLLFTPVVDSMGGVSMFMLTANSKLPGALVSYYINNPTVIRPVITLKKGVYVKDGEGTATNPFTIEGTDD